MILCRILTHLCSSLLTSTNVAYIRHSKTAHLVYQIVPLAQRVARGATARRFYSILLKCGAILNRAIERATSGKDDVSVLDKAIEQCALLVGPMRSMFSTDHPKMKEAKDLRFKLREWKELTAVYRKLKNKDPLSYYGEFTDAVKRGTKILDVPHTQEMEDLYQSCKNRLDNCVGLKLDPVADEALYTLNEGKQFGRANAYILSTSLSLLTDLSLSNTYYPVHKLNIISSF